MNRNQYVDKIAKTLCADVCTDKCHRCQAYDHCKVTLDACVIYDSGYREPSEVALKLIEEISTYCTSEDSPNIDFAIGYLSAMNKVLRGLHELKIKYVEGN